MAFAEAGENSLINTANRLTLIRILCVPLFIGSLLYYSSERAGLRVFALFIFLLACLTDAVDGWIARRWRQETALGKYLDPVADKVLLAGGFLICL